MATMRKLSHIYLLGCHNLERIPPNLSQLHNLRTFTTFVVDTEDGFGIEELKELRTSWPKVGIQFGKSKDWVKGQYPWKTEPKGTLVILEP
ncbi:hypothetical protein PVAP13_6NG342950 [Panicum virgatum]|uniref:Uncharacterized protein n=1 Tax=Panicum virgatum TaxID=38727 RepID=A0A8T0R5B9_PANVG|nr:hypothetical protein PVAP13_6NG342950 [Panicum virgatum]